MNTVNIIDKDYAEWLKNLQSRYRRCQIKAAVKVNQEVIRFYWELGHDIVDMHVEERWGESIMDKLAVDLKKEIPGISGISRRNIYYCKQFYLLYNQKVENLPQVVAQIDDKQETNSFWQNSVHSLSAFPNMNWRNSIRRR